MSIAFGGRLSEYRSWRRGQRIAVSDGSNAMYPAAVHFQNIDLIGGFLNVGRGTANTGTAAPYSRTLIPSAFILRYRWLRSSPSSSAARLTLLRASSTFLRM
jgi:hypothetical protein